MVKVLAYIFCFILICLGIFQILLIIGLPLGHYAWGGQHNVLPIGFRIGSVLSLFIYLFFGLVILQRSKLINFFKNQKIVTFGTWFVVGYSFLGILANFASRSKNERLVMGPLVTIMAIISLVIALKTRLNKTVKD